MAGLPFRRLIEDTFDLRARPMLPSVNTLTIRRDPLEGHRMFLHRRNARAVAAAGGMYHVVPAGAFQPALSPAHQANDFSFWRNIQSELEMSGSAAEGRYGFVSGPARKGPVRTGPPSGGMMHSFPMCKPVPITQRIRPGTSVAMDTGSAST